MKIAVSASGSDLEAQVDPRFGRAPYFLIVDTDTMDFDVVPNQPNLQVSDNPIDTEMLVVADGTVTSLGEAVTGDRPVLLWFWAPH